MRRSWDVGYQGLIGLVVSNRIMSVQGDTCANLRTGEDTLEARLLTVAV
jgi:hypothetical protein